MDGGEENALEDDALPPMDRGEVESEGAVTGRGVLTVGGAGGVITLGGATVGAGAFRWKNEGILKDGILNPPPRLGEP